MTNTSSVQKSEIVPGATFYHVTAVPREDGSLEVWTSEILVTKSPYMLDLEFVKRQVEMFEADGRLSSGEIYNNTYSIKDCNVEYNGYNLHGLFRTPEDAKEYADRMEALDFDEEEECIYQNHLRNIREDDFDHWDDY